MRAANDTLACIDSTQRIDEANVEPRVIAGYERKTIARAHLGCGGARQRADALRKMPNAH